MSKKKKISPLDFNTVWQEEKKRKLNYTNEDMGLIVTRIQCPRISKGWRLLPVVFEVECVENELGLPQGVVRLLLGGKAHTLGHLCRVAAGSLALDPHLQVHRCLPRALGPIVHGLGHIKAFPSSLVNGDQPMKGVEKDGGWRGVEGHRQKSRGGAGALIQSSTGWTSHLGREKFHLSIYFNKAIAHRESTRDVRLEPSAMTSTQ